MISLKKFIAENGYPIRAVRYFIEEKLTRDIHYTIEKKTLMLLNDTQEIIHDRFRERKNFPISYRRIRNEFGYKIHHLKEIFMEGRDYMLITKLYHFSLDAYAKLEEAELRGIDIGAAVKEKERLSEGLRFTDMNESQKNHWADSVGLSQAARDLIFK